MSSTDSYVFAGNLSCQSALLQRALQIQFIVCPNGKASSLTGLLLLYEQKLRHRLHELGVLLQRCENNISGQGSYYDLRGCKAIARFAFREPGDGGEWLIPGKGKKVYAAAQSQASLEYLNENMNLPTSRDAAEEAADKEAWLRKKVTSRRVLGAIDRAVLMWEFILIMLKNPPKLPSIQQMSNELLREHFQTIVDIINSCLAVACASSVPSTVHGVGKPLTQAPKYGQAKDDHGAGYEAWLLIVPLLMELIKGAALSKEKYEQLAGISMVRSIGLLLYRVRAPFDAQLTTYVVNEGIVPLGVLLRKEPDMMVRNKFPLVASFMLTDQPTNATRTMLFSKLGIVKEIIDLFLRSAKAAMKENSCLAGEDLLNFIDLIRLVCLFLMTELPQVNVPRLHLMAHKLYQHEATIKVLQKQLKPSKEMPEDPHNSTARRALATTDLRLLDNVQTLLVSTCAPIARYQADVKANPTKRLESFERSLPMDSNKFAFSAIMQVAEILPQDAHPPKGLYDQMQTLFRLAFALDTKRVTWHPDPYLALFGAAGSSPAAASFPLSDDTAMQLGEMVDSVLRTDKASFKRMIYPWPCDSEDSGRGSEENPASMCLPGNVHPKFKLVHLISVNNFISDANKLNKTMNYYKKPEMMKHVMRWATQLPEIAHYVSSLKSTDEGLPDQIMNDFFKSLNFLVKGNWKRFPKLGGQMLSCFADYYANHPAKYPLPGVLMDLFQMECWERRQGSDTDGTLKFALQGLKSAAYCATNGANVQKFIDRASQPSAQELSADLSNDQKFYEEEMKLLMRGIGIARVMDEVKQVPPHEHAAHLESLRLHGPFTYWKLKLAASLSGQFLSADFRVFEENLMNFVCRWTKVSEMNKDALMEASGELADCRENLLDYTNQIPDSFMAAQRCLDHQPILRFDSGFEDWLFTSTVIVEFEKRGYGQSELEVPAEVVKQDAETAPETANKLKVQEAAEKAAAELLKAEEMEQNRQAKKREKINKRKAAAVKNKLSADSKKASQAQEAEVPQQEPDASKLSQTSRLEATSQQQDQSMQSPSLQDSSHSDVPDSSGVDDGDWQSTTRRRGKTQASLGMPSAVPMSASKKKSQKQAKAKPPAKAKTDASRKTAVEAKHGQRTAQGTPNAPSSQGSKPLSKHLQDLSLAGNGDQNLRLDSNRDEESWPALSSQPASTSRSTMLSDNSAWAGFPAAVPHKNQSMEKEQQSLSSPPKLAPRKAATEQPAPATLNSNGPVDTVRLVSNATERSTANGSRVPGPAQLQGTNARQAGQETQPRDNDDDDILRDLFPDLHSAEASRPFSNQIERPRPIDYLPSAWSHRPPGYTAPHVVSQSQASLFGNSHSSIFSDDEIEEEPASARADIVRPNQSQSQLPPDGRGSSQRQRQLPERPTVPRTQELDKTDARSADSSDEHDWNPEEGQSETLLQLRAMSPSRRRPMPSRALPKPVGGGHGWAGPPAAATPVPGLLVPSGGGHGGPRQIKSKADSQLPGVPGRLFSTEQLEEFYLCPITQEIMVDPVFAKDGFTYEREAISAWLLKHDTSPLTNERLNSKELQPNQLARQMISAIFDNF